MNHCVKQMLGGWSDGIKFSPYATYQSALFKP